MKNKRSLRKLLFTICLIGLLVNVTFAHPGRTDSSGGHYVRTAGWGYPVGSYHYHNSGTSSSSSSTSSYTYTKNYNVTGLSKSEVIELQKMLDELGYSPGPIDGSFGPKTYWALRMFELENNLVIDGVADEYTLTKLRVVAGYNSTPSAVTNNTSNVPNLSTKAAFNDSEYIQVQIALNDIYINGSLVNNFKTDYPFVKHDGWMYMPLRSDYLQSLGMLLSVDDVSINVDSWATPYILKDNFMNSNWTSDSTFTATKTNKMLVNNKIISSHDYISCPIFILNNIYYLPITDQVFVTELGLNGWVTDKRELVLFNPDFYSR